MKKWMWVGILAVSWGCSSVEVKEEVKNIHHVHRLILQNLRVRRPAGLGADPHAGPGGVDYFSQALPNAKLDCDSLENLFKDFNLPEVRACLNLVSAPMVLRYRLKRLSVPELVLDEKNSGMDQGNGVLLDCIKERLSKLPVPREIFFQSHEEGPLSCYSARLNLESDEIPVLGVKWPLSRTVVRVDLPLTKPLDSDQKTIQLLASWVLSSYFTEESDEILSRLVPDHLCGKCFQKAKFYKNDDALPVLWPESWKENP